MIASNREWPTPHARTPRELVEVLKTHTPQYIFFPYWSWKIPPEIFEEYECIAFHMTNLPYGRGGSPLQNLIIRGATKTKLTAFRVTEEMDAGPVYLKEDLPLVGTAREILARADMVISSMIDAIKKYDLKATPQKGFASTFKRRTPEQSNMLGVYGAEAIYDHIRMLDGGGYPRAYMEIDNKRIEFDGAKLDGDKVTARATIT